LKLIPDEVKRQILGLWMDGMTLRQISLEKKVSTGEISNIINVYRQGNPGLDELRKLHLALGEAKKSGSTF